MIGDRLRAERERLGLTQPAFAEVAGAKKRTLIDWEKGVSSPTAAQLAALAGLGVDVQYVVTGSMAPPALGAEESTLLSYFREATPEVRRAAMGALIGAGPSAQAPNRIRDLTMHNTSPGGVQVGIQSGGTIKTGKR
ncbi:helix-turn-helix transcriptional regulator [Acidovorax sp. Root219]|uniref:helix-turn-helix transcriptional regulator n=1 Tax=Acidovorax sp. Root219 TaxID=1736493 RepID=UPI0009E9F6F1|nr:helix-turn-helix domain-containing protein [Acidovorax sp. Root219]